MANYCSIDISTTLPASGLIYADYSSNSSWITHGRDIDVGLAAPTDKTYTQYKLWGYGAYTIEGDVSWQDLPASGTIGVTLDDEVPVQILSARFRDAALAESGVVTNSGISFDFDIPSKSTSLLWIGLTDENDTSIILRNTTDNIDLTFDKVKLDDLRYHDRDFSGITIVDNIITVVSGSEIGKFVDNDVDGYVPTKKVFTTDNVPMINVDIGDGYKTLTTFSGAIKSDVTGDYLDRITGYNWNTGSKELNFNIYKFSSYGFVTVNDLSFTSDSITAGYINTSIELKVSVYDTSGEGVENAPVTFSGTGDNIGSFSADPVYTDSNGVATATLNLDTLGSATYDASCDGVHTTTDQLTWCFQTINAERSSLEQPTQVNMTLTYDDAVADIYTSAVAEPTVSGSLEEDMNVIRTLMKEFKGGTNWYDDLGNYFDPADTDSGDAENKDLNLTNIKNNTLDSKTIIIPVEANNSGNGFTVSGTNTGFLYNTSLSYAIPTDRRGIPIFKSTTNSGTYQDESESDEVCVVDLIDLSTGAEFEDVSGNLIYAKFHDGADWAGGTGTGTDVYVRFYANNTLYTWTSGDPTSIMIIFPLRRVMNEMKEYEWLRTDFINGFEGDVELIDDIVNLWSYTGAIDSQTDPVWTSASGNYILDGNPSDLETAIDLLNTEIGDKTYTSATYLTDDEDITVSLDSLSDGIISNDTDITTNAGDISTNAGNITTNANNITTNAGDIDDLEAAVGSSTGVAGLDYSSNNYVTDATSLETAIGALDAALTLSHGEKYIETFSSDVVPNVEHILPYGIIYTPDSTADQEGKNMDVYVSGQLVAADTGAAGVNADRDYGETSVSGISFRFTVYSGINITYVIRQ